MLKWITGGKVDHPLADPKQARALIAELPAFDPVKALDEITRWLDSLSETEGFKLDRLFEVVDLLDTTGRPHHRKVMADYLSMSRQQKQHENRLWMCGYHFAKSLGGSYLTCARRHESGASGASAIRKQMPVIVTRALRSLALQVKWTMLRYASFEPGLWASIGELYGIADKGGYVRTTIAAYPGPQANGTVEHDYLKVMTLWASSADALPPLKQDIAERIAAELADRFKLATAPFEGAIYRFDPSEDRPPSRIFQQGAVAGQQHYFGPGTAPAKVAEAIDAIERTGKLPPDFNLGATYPEETVLAVLRHVAAYWSDKPPARASERRSESARITVVPGYLQLLDELERDESDALNFSESVGESWVVENVSENGYGALVPAATTDWIRVGELIGIQLEGSGHWGIGAVRRVARDEQRQYHVGIEVLAREVRMVRVTHARARDAEPAILLAANVDPGCEVGLLIRAGRFDPGHAMAITIGGRELMLKPLEMINAGDDYDWARYSASPIS